MREDFEKNFEEKDIFGIIARYQDMLNHQRSCFFDLFEFEDIIDYYIENEEYSDAQEASKIALKQYPFSTSLKLRYAKTLCEKNKISSAFGILKEIEGVESYNSELYLLKGNLLHKSGKQEEAIKEYDKAIRLACENRDELVFSVARSFIDSGKEDLAIKYLLLAHELNDNNLLVLYELASCFEHIGDHDRTIEFLQKFLEIDPFAENIWYNIGVSYSNLEQFEKAIEALDYALVLNEKYISAYHSKAEIYYNSGNYEEAVSVYRDLLLMDADNVRYFCCIGNCYEKAGDSDQALEYFKEAKRIDNRFPDAWYGMAAVYKNMGKLHHSLMNIRKAIKLEPENAFYWFFLGVVYSGMHSNENALKAFSKAIEIDPSDYEAWLAYAKIYYEENRITDAIEVLNRAYQYNYDISTVNYQLAAYHTLARHYSDAARYFEKGLSLNYSEHHDYLNQMQEHFDKETIFGIISKFQK
jgi:tetratricopeptide (TPR) repeat protein